jgi:hypothetical protein
MTTTIDNDSHSDNKDYDNDNVNRWSYYYLVDNIFNNLMGSNKYIIQAITKFQYFRRKSPVTFFEICIKDIKDETKKEFDLYLKDCKSQDEAYKKLDGIITEIIALIYKEAQPLILSGVEHMDPVWVEKAINEIRTLVSKKWRFV